MTKAISLIAIVMLVACSNKQSSQESDVAVSSPAGEGILGAQDLFVKEGMAAKGDPDAALEVANHYSFQKNAEARYWLMVAAENGSPLAMHILSGELFKEGGRVSCARSLFWLAQLEKQKGYVAGHPEPGFLDKERDAILRSTKHCQEKHGSE